jgi:hypothetical protein
MKDYRSSEWNRPNSDITKLEAPPPPMAPSVPTAYAHRHRSSHRSSRSSRRKIRQLKLLTSMLLILLVIVSVAAVMIFFRMEQYRGDAGQLRMELRQAEGELARSREKIIEMENDLRVLLANRIPGIKELIMNRQIEINDQYVRNITFVQSGLDDNKGIEFSSVLQNQRSGPILPDVTIVLFDESGLQTGIIQLDKEQTVSPVDIPEMQPGETRTYSGQIPMQRRVPSKYFVIDVN